MFRWLSRHLDRITFLRWLLVLLMSQAIYVVMLLYSIPRINDEASGLRLFDMRPMGYSYEYAQQFLSQLTDKGYELYMYVQLPLDLLYPALFGITGIYSIVLLIRLYNKVNKLSHWSMDSLSARMLLLVPVISIISDYAENLFIFSMLSYQAEVPELLVFSANLFTISKSMATTAFYMIAMMIGIQIGVAWLGLKSKGEQTGGENRGSREESRTAQSIDHGRDGPAAQAKTT